MPQLTAFFGLEGSGRAERAARSGLPLAHTREEALRLLRAGISCALDAPDLKARGRKDLVERARAYGAQARARARRAAGGGVHRRRARPGGGDPRSGPRLLPAAAL